MTNDGRVQRYEVPMRVGGSNRIEYWRVQPDGGLSCPPRRLQQYEVRQQAESGKFVHVGPAQGQEAAQGCQAHLLHTLLTCYDESRCTAARSSPLTSTSTVPKRGGGSGTKAVVISGVASAFANVYRVAGPKTPTPQERAVSILLPQY